MPARLVAEHHSASTAEIKQAELDSDASSLITTASTIWCGVAIHMTSTTTVQVDLIKNWQIAWPRLENEKFIMTIGSTRPMEDAARIAYRELVRWLVADYGFDQYEAYFLLTQAGRIRVGNMVEPKYTLGASILKSYVT